MSIRKARFKTLAGAAEFIYNTVICADRLFRTRSGTWWVVWSE